MGHIEPFNLEYLGIGNEDLIDDVFKNRFQQIFDAVKAAHPEITVVGTVGPAPSGQDYEQGWAYAREAGIPIVDEHSYQSSSWWFHNLDHYDHTDRKGRRSTSANTAPGTPSSSTACPKRRSWDAWN